MSLDFKSCVFLMTNRMIGTGIFSIPSSIYQLTGSVGYTLLFWVLGGSVAACGFTVYLEYGLQMPFSGGEKNYLERVYKYPPQLVVTMFCFCAVILSFSSSNAFALGNYVQLGLGTEPDTYTTKWIACTTVGVICFLHYRFPNAGRRAFGALGLAKLIVLVFIAVLGILLGFQIIEIDNGNVLKHNFGSQMWQNDGFGGGLYEVGVALLRVSYSYRGWETCNMVLGEVNNPAVTMKYAGIVSLVMVMGLYLLCNFAYFAAIYKEDVANSGVVIAGIFLMKLFGESASARLLPLLICLSNLGNIMVVSYATSRVTEAVGKMNLLPFSAFFSKSSRFKTPTTGLLLHFVMTVITVALPPPGDVYNFVVDISTYPVAVFAFMITIGLIFVHKNPQYFDWDNDKPRAPIFAIVVFLMSNSAMLIFPWFKPPTSKAGLPYYASPLASLVLLGLGAVYWMFAIYPTVSHEDRLPLFTQDG